jgi:hypothetical protein
MREIADLSLHLTPESMSREIQKLESDVPIFLHHLKPPCVDRIYSEVKALGNPRLRFLQQGKIYDW